MAEKRELHPSVQQFKQFIYEHPALMKEVNEGRQSLQSLYEEWVVLGNDHEKWHQFKEEKKETDGRPNDQDTLTSNEEGDPLSSFMTMMKQMNIVEIQSFLGQVSSVIENVQGVMQLFQQNHSEQKTFENDFPFSFRQD